MNTWLAIGSVLLSVATGVSFYTAYLCFTQERSKEMDKKVITLAITSAILILSTFIVGKVGIYKLEEEFNIEQAKVNELLKNKEEELRTKE